GRPPEVAEFGVWVDSEGGDGLNSCSIRTAEDLRHRCPRVPDAVGLRKSPGLDYHLTSSRADHRRANVVRSEVPVRWGNSYRLERHITPFTGDQDLAQ